MAHPPNPPGAALGLLLVLGCLLAGCPARMDDVEKFTRDGNILLDNGRYAEAEALFHRALEQRPDAPGLRTNRGNARMLQGNHAGARADFDAALAADPGFALAYANRGILRDRTGDTPGAIADYRRALELDPGLGEGPGIWERIIGNPSTDTIRGRMEYLMSRQRGGRAAPGKP